MTMYRHDARTHPASAGVILLGATTKPVWRVLLVPRAPDRLHLALALHLLATAAYAVAAKTQAVPSSWAWCCAPSVAGAVTLEFFSQLLISVFCLLDALLLLPGGAPGADAHMHMLLLTERACAHFRATHVAMATKWIGTQLPVRVMLLPELARGAACLGVACAAVAAWQPGGLTPHAALWLLLHACGATACTLAAVCACHNRAFSLAHLPPVLLSCPRALRPHLAAAASWLEELTSAHLHDEPLTDFSTLLGTVFAVISLCAFTGLTGVLTVSRRVNYVCAAGTLVSFASRLPAGTTTHLRLLQRRLGVADAQHMHMSLCAQLDGCTSEHHVLWAAAEALRALFPAATALALGLLTDDDASAVGRREVTLLRVAATHEPQRRALHAALQGAVVVDGPGAASMDDPAGAAAAAAGCDTSVAFVCSEAASRGVIIADSNDWPRGCFEFADWREAARDDEGTLLATHSTQSSSAERYVTASIVCTGKAVGFVILRFAAASGFVTRADGDGDGAAQESLRLFAEAVGNAVQVRRAQDASDAAARALAQAASLAQSVFPPHMLDAVQARLAAAERPDGGRTSQLAALAPAMSEDHADVTVICADVVGFAALSAERSPSETMRLLDTLWQLFDSLVVGHACYKLETVLDGYVIVAGMLPARHDHAQVAVRLALELHAAAARVGSPPGLQLRIGVHCGPVTCGVVGHLRPRFACFGHTVHVASRVRKTAIAAA
jgi:class 3 adenylate cyclase